MTVGESLTEARHRAGLSVDELSERTRIRGTVIRSIEHDDYEACGGDLYVRGYVRAIAGAVGIDAQPLIREYDQGRATAMIASTATRFDLPSFPGDSEATRLDLPPVTGDLPPLTEDLMAAGYELPPRAPAAPAGPPAGDDRDRAGAAGAAGAASAAGAAGVAGAASARSRNRGSGRGLLAAAAVVIVLAIGGIVGVHIASSSTTSRNTAATSVPKPTASSSSAPRASASASPQPTGTASPVKTAAPARSTGARAGGRPPITILPIAAAEAFGPAGLADGDNPGSASYAIAGNAPLPWSTQWYDTPNFGMLKHGTGLLLDLGHRVTITSVRLDLADYQGANLQLRVGDGTNPGDFRVAATATGTGGVVRLTLHGQASARYLLIWFTLLPPNGSGQYEESVSHVVVNGRRS